MINVLRWLAGNACWYLSIFFEGWWGWASGWFATWEIMLDGDAGKRILEASKEVHREGGNVWKPRKRY